MFKWIKATKNINYWKNRIYKDYGIVYKIPFSMRFSKLYYKIAKQIANEYWKLAEKEAHKKYMSKSYVNNKKAICNISSYDRELMQKYDLTEYDVKCGKKYLSAFGKASCMVLDSVVLPQNPEKLLLDDEKLTMQEALDGQKYMSALWRDALNPVTTAEYINSMNNVCAAYRAAYGVKE